MKKNLLLIGYGNMGSSFINPIHELFNVTIASPNSKPTFNCEYFNNLWNVKSKQDYIVFSIKPNMIEEIIINLKQNSKIYDENTHFISLMAGINREYFISNFFKNIKISLVMANIPIKYKKGILGVLSDYELEFLNNLGTVIKLKDISEFYKCTSLFGSGSGFVYKILDEYKNQIKINLGLSNEESEKLTLNLFEGSFMNIKNEDKEFSDLVKQVKSPNGTTEAGLKYLENIDKIFDNTITASFKRAEELSIN